MRQRVSSFRVNNKSPRALQTRVIVTALLEQDDYLLLVQLARGRFAGYWLLPSATVEEQMLEQTLRQMAPERTGYPVSEPRLVSVVEESRTDTRVLRFVFQACVGTQTGSPSDVEIASARWFSHAAAREVLEERDVVPTLGVMALIRGWAEGITLSPLESLVDDVLCPCGSGFRYPGCCGWDMQ